MTQRASSHMADPHLAACETTVVPENWSGSLEVRSALDGTVTNGGVARYQALSGGHLVPSRPVRIGDDTVWLQMEHQRTSRRRDRPGGPHRVVRAATASPSNGGPCRSPAASPTTSSSTSSRASRSPSRSSSPCTPPRTGPSPSRRRGPRAGRRGARRLRPAARAHVAGLGPALAPLPTSTWAATATSRSPASCSLHLFHLLQTVSAAHHRPRRRRPGPGPARRGLPRPRLLGRAVRLPVPQPALPRAHPGAARATATAGCPRPARRPRAAGLRGGDVPVAERQRRPRGDPALHLNPRSGRWLPDHSRLPAPRRHRRSPTTSGSTTRPPATWSSCDAYGRRDAARDRPLLGEHRQPTTTARDRYEIRGVMGPDEYHDGYPDATSPGLDNNAYTNVMAAWVLCRALETLRAAARAPPRPSCAERLGLRQRGARPLGRRSAASSACRFHDGGIISQFEGYGDLERARLGRLPRSATATSAGWTGSWRPRATPPTATRPPSRPTC